MISTKYAYFSRQIPSFLYKILAQSWIDKTFPRHIFIETTASCNLRCDFCPRERINQHMDFELFKSIVSESSEYGPRSFSLHLFGEPLLYPGIMEAIEYIKTKNKRHTILLTTNGTLLNKFARRLLDSGVDRIIWSWRTLKDPFSSDTLKVLKRIGLVRFLIEETPDGEIEKWEGFEKEVKHLHNYGGNIDAPNKSYEKRHPCYHLWLAPAVRWNGEIVECCNIPQSGTEVLGRYGETSINEVWTGNKIKILRESHMKGIYPGACTNCNSWQAYPDLFYSWQKS